MIRWFWRFLTRFVAFFVGMVAFAQALSYVLGSDEEVKAAALANRGITAIIIGLGAIAFAMFDWLDRGQP